jgi:hypothetical protein
VSRALTTEEARELAGKRHSLDTYIKSIVDRAPELTPDQKSKLAAALRPSRPSDSRRAA